MRIILWHHNFGHGARSANGNLPCNGSIPGYMALTVRMRGSLGQQLVRVPVLRPFHAEDGWESAMKDLLRRLFLSRFVQWAGGGVLMTQTLRWGRAGAQARGPVSSFDHVALPMLNVEAMVRFYRALGFQVSEGARICSVHFGDQKINFYRPELWEDEQFTLRAPSALPPCGDSCFVWEGDRAGLVQALGRAGAEVIEGPVERRGGRNGGTAMGMSHYTRDPDGNLLEFIVY